MVLHWPRRLLTAEDLRRHWNGQRELAVDSRTVVTPSAYDELRMKSVSVSRKIVEPEMEATEHGAWCCAQDNAYPMVSSALQTMSKYGDRYQKIPAPTSTLCRWAREIAERVAQHEFRGGVVFCSDPGLVCCVANKVAGVRSAVSVNITQAARASLTLAANLLVVEMPGRTFFEIRQIMRQLCESKQDCPATTAATLRELESDADR